MDYIFLLYQSLECINQNSWNCPREPSTSIEERLSASTTLYDLLPYPHNPSPIIFPFDIKLRNILYESKRYLSAAKKWNGFVKNNIYFEESFLKEGDKIEIFGSRSFADNILMKEGIVLRNPERFSDGITIKTKDFGGEEYVQNIVIPLDYRIKINGKEEQPRFYIKRKKKKYVSKK